MGRQLSERVASALGVDLFGVLMAALAQVRRGQPAAAPATQPAEQAGGERFHAQAPAEAGSAGPSGAASVSSSGNTGGGAGEEDGAARGGGGSAAAELVALMGPHILASLVSEHLVRRLRACMKDWRGRVLSGRPLRGDLRGAAGRVVRA